MAKRAREQAVKEKREMKRARKLESAADRAAARAAAAEGRDVPEPGAVELGEGPAA